MLLLNLNNKKKNELILFVQVEMSSDNKKMLKKRKIQPKNISASFANCVKKLCTGENISSLEKKLFHRFDQIYDLFIQASKTQTQSSSSSSSSFYSSSSSSSSTKKYKWNETQAQVNTIQLNTLLIPIKLTTFDTSENFRTTKLTERKQNIYKMCSDRRFNRESIHLGNALIKASTLLDEYFLQYFDDYDERAFEYINQKAPKTLQQILNDLYLLSRSKYCVKQTEELGINAWCFETKTTVLEAWLSRAMYRSNIYSDAVIFLLKQPDIEWVVTNRLNYFVTKDYLFDGLFDEWPQQSETDTIFPLQVLFEHYCRSLSVPTPEIKMLYDIIQLSLTQFTIKIKEVKDTLQLYFPNVLVHFIVDNVLGWNANPMQPVLWEEGEGDDA